jgi:proteasome alpha subunit
VTVPFYVSPEQLTRDRLDFARVGVARGKAVIVQVTVEGVLLVTENPSRSLHKIAEIYDRVAFAGVGKYNEFEALRRAGVRHADLRGYAYDRVDVDARSLAAAYAQTLGEAFTAQLKPFEVEIALAEVGPVPSADRIFRIRFDGSLWEAAGSLVIGGRADELAEHLAAELGGTPDRPPSLARALAAVRGVLERDAGPVPDPAGRGAAPDPVDHVGGDAVGARGPAGALPVECAVQDRAAPRRAFRRLTKSDVLALAAP